MSIKLINSTNEYNLKISETKLFINSFFKNEKLLLPVSRNFRGHTFVSTCLLISLALRINAIKINKNNRKIFDPVVYLINSGSPTDTKISINNNNNSSPKFTDGNNANNKAFNE